ncbi:MAG: N-formylglutamate amidohydrolase [Gammaproteobacteria bacterium]|nr:N-formylglutamate amidohydrolase [Gammaproteobacteria bacterium]
MSDMQNTPAKLLSPDEPSPFETVNPDGAGEVLLTCEHAGKLLPERVAGLGLSSDDLERHIGYDIGAAGLARRLSKVLDATLVVQRYSRLVIDCNRPAGAKDLIPEISDSTRVPGNMDLSDAERRMRYEEIHQPFHTEIAHQIARKKSRAVIAVHSFNRTVDQEQRDFHVGLLFNRDSRFAQALRGPIAHEIGIQLVALNRPYAVEDESDETIPRHGEATGLLHVLLEVRNDRIRTEEGQRKWAALLSQAINEAMAAVS